jgi:metal-sulfur cluster biosynthetic enzyme
MSTNVASSDATGITLGPGEDTSTFERELWSLVDEIPDPHIPVSLVEMGMIYDIREKEGVVTVEMTFPCMGCPAYDFIQNDIKSILRPVDGVTSVTIDIVWDPVWSKDMLESDVRDKIRNAGISL